VVKRKKGVDRRKFDIVLTVVALGEMPNLNPHLLISFLDEIIELEGVY
jgi:hypothetical protein